MTVYFGLVGHK